MSKSKITTLLVLPLIASAVFLASPAVSSADGSPLSTHSEVRHKTTKDAALNAKEGKENVAGTVASINGTIILVNTREDVEYIVDASNATIMKASSEPNSNPNIVPMSEVKVGDFILVRGVIKDIEVS